MRSTAPAEQDAATTEPEHLAHIVAREGATAAVVEGTSVVTLCGRWLVPSHDPRRVPRCPRCLEILERIGVEPPAR